MQHFVVKCNLGVERRPSPRKRGKGRRALRNRTDFFLLEGVECIGAGISVRVRLPGEPVAVRDCPPGLLVARIRTAFTARFRSLRTYTGLQPAGQLTGV